MGRSCAFLDYVTINIIFYFAVQFRVQPGMLHVWVFHVSVVTSDFFESKINLKSLRIFGMEVGRGFPT